MLFTPQPGQCVLDIGANDGTYAERYATAVGPKGYVHAVEPHHEAARAARARVTGTPWVTVQTVAISDRSGVSAFTWALKDTRHSSLWPENVPGEAVPCEVHTTTVDTLVCTMRRPPDWIKVDVQGAEGLVLAGAQRTLDDRRATWCIELWEMGLRNAGTSSAAVIREFSERGYVPTIDGHQTTWPKVVEAAERKTGHGSIDVICAPPQSSEA